MTDFELRETADLSGNDLEQLHALHREAFADTPRLGDQPMEWTMPEWWLTCFEDELPISKVGIVVREGLLAGRPVVIGGIGGVATLPAYRGKGLASIGLTRAQEFLVGRAHLGLLVCRDVMVPFYEARGWRTHHDTVWIVQFGERVRFILSPVMVRSITPGLEIDGEVDLCGPPW